MKRTSSPVSSSQTGIHKRLESVVVRNMNSTWKQPLHQPSVAAFEKLVGLEEFDPKARLILDSGCGTGASTRAIAARFPESLVIGIDRSAARLARLGRHELPFRQGNAIWIQAELATFWRLALERGWRLKRHYLLYPNPWPKPGQLQRRWHAHPVFPQMLELGGILEMRTNWAVFASEFETAVGIVRPKAKTESGEAGSEQDWDSIMTPFGTKYGASGHQLYRVVAHLGQESGRLTRPG